MKGPIDAASRARGRRVEIEPAPVDVRIEMRCGVAVAVPARPVPPITADEVEAIRRRIREDRYRRAIR